MKNPLVLSAAIFLTLGAASTSDAAITFIIEEFSSTTFTFSISGTLSQNSGIGFPTDLPGNFAIGMGRIAVDFYNTSVPVTISGSIFSSLSPNPQLIQVQGGRGIFFNNGSPLEIIPAGTAYSGRVTLTGDFYAGLGTESFALWSATNPTTGSYTRRIADAQTIPEPSISILGGLAGLGVLRRRRS